MSVASDDESNDLACTVLIFDFCIGDVAVCQKTWRTVETESCG